jgi:hypothetical protein
MEEVEDHMNEDTLKEIRQEYSTLRSEYSELNQLRQRMKKDEARCKRRVDTIRLKIQELSSDSSILASRNKEEECEILQGLSEIDSSFMQTPTLFLRLIIGDISVTLPYKEDRVTYKAKYEKFKMFHTVCMCALAIFSLLFPHFAILGGLVHCVSVWYYFTVTLRELILISNGSKINWWWMTHHYCSIAVSGLLLAWPPGECYQAFKNQFMLFTTILSLVMALQFRYQRAKMYRKVALGLKHHMSVSHESKLAIKNLLLGLVGVYMFQLYNAYTLYKLYQSPNIDCDRWQVPLLAFLFLILAVMNSATLFTLVIYKPLRKRNKVEKYKSL